MADKKEIWKPIVCQDIVQGWYEVSNLGNVRSAKTKRLLSPFLSKGYMRIGLMTYERHQQKFPVHRLVALAFVPGFSKERHFVNHMNGNKTCNESDNLEWVTASENTRHAIQTGLLVIVSGERNGASHITNDTAKRICELLVEFNGYVPAVYKQVLYEGIEIGAPGLIYHIRNKGTWVHMSDSYFQCEDFDKNKGAIKTITTVRDNDNHITIFESIGKAAIYLSKKLEGFTIREIYSSIMETPEYYYGFRLTYYVDGYLVGSLNRFNDGKRAEERDRVKHGVTE